MMADIRMDVDAAVAEVPVNILPLIDDTDFKTREVAVAYDQAGMDLVWNFVTTVGATTQTAVTPTTGGDYDWAHQGDGMYTIEIPASGGASINNDTEGFGWFTGFATGVLPWRGPIIGFRAAAINDALIDGATLVVASVTGAVGSVTGAVGSVTGAVGSVTGNVGGNVVGTVASVVGNVGGNVVGSVASVSGAVGSVTGAVGSVTGAVGSVAGNVDGSTASVVGAVGSVTGAVGSVTGAVGSVTGAVGSVTGAVGSVTGNVGGNVVGTVASVVGAVGSVAGNVDGSVASVVGAVGSVTGAVGSVIGAVGSVTGNVGGNVVGTVASVVGAVGSVTGAVGSVTGNVGGNVAGTVASVVGAVGSVTGHTAQTGDSFTRIGAPVGASISADVAALNDLSAAQVNAEVLDVVNVDTYAEPGQAAPGATVSLAAKINYLYKAFRNKITQTATTLSLFNDAGGTVDQKATVSDDGVTYTRGEIVSGP